MRIDNAAILLVLSAMVLLPLVESLLRATLGVGISGSDSIVQHLTLAVGMIGGAIGARENRLLALATGDMLPEGRLRDLGTIFSHGFAAAVTALLTVAGVQFVISERAAANEFVYGIPLWIVQSLLPLGFSAVTLGLSWHASHRWTGRALGVGLSVAIIACGALPPEHLVKPALLLLLLATAFGAPVFTTLGGAAVILFWGAGQPIASIPLDHYRLVTNPTLPTIPLFTLAGYFLAEGGASKRLIHVFHTLFGRLRGGPAIVTALVCAFFTSFTGASGVTILALGGLLMPILLSARYTEKTALGLLTGAGSLGLLFPPCLPLILYAIVARVEMQTMFLAGIIPGLLLVLLTAWWGIQQGPKVEATGAPFDFGAANRAVWDAKWELLLPVVALASMFGGFATMVEAAALTALYAFVIEAFVYRDLKLREVPRVTSECGLLVGGVLLILGVALGFTNYLIDAQIPMRLLDWVTASIHSPWVFLLLLNLFLLVVGCLMDIFSAIVVVVPLIVPLGEAFHIDPIHLGIVFLANLELGYLTPPVGMNLFLASYRFKKALPEVYRAALPMMFVLLVGVLLITYIPALTTFLPSLFAR